MPHAQRASAKVLQARIAQLSIALLVKDGEPPPTEFRIFAPGSNETSKGVYKFTEASGRNVLKAAATRGNDFAVDYGHAMHSMLQLDPAEGLKAAGWFEPEVRDDGGLWAKNVRWTPKATQKLSDREFRYFSPVFRHSEAGEVLELISVGLTNTPATYGQEPLMASAAELSNPSPPERHMELAQLTALLSMSASASEADVMAELARRGAQLAELSALTGQKELNGVLGAVKAWKAAADSVASLTQRISELETKATDGLVTAMLTAAKAEGKVTPAMEPMMRGMPVEQLKAFLSTLPVYPGVKTHQEPGAAGGVAGPNGQVMVMLSTEEQAVAKMVGVPLDKLAAAKASTNGQVVTAETRK